MARESACVTGTLTGSNETPSEWSAQSAIVDRFRILSAHILLISIVSPTFMAVAIGIRVNPHGTELVAALVALLLVGSRIGRERADYRRVADAAGTLAMVTLSGTACGAIAMLGLRFQFPLADGLLSSWDRTLGVDGIAVTEWLARQPRWIFDVMSPAYNYTIGIFGLSLIALSVMRDRVEAWRAAFCFLGTLLTTCLFAVFFPAKGLGVWATDDLFDRLPVLAMRSFWPQFDAFYFGSDPVLSLQAVGGVISFPSFHSVVGFLVLTMWRKRPATLLPTAVWLLFMLVATLPGGGHYIVDLLAGFTVWAVWFTVSLKIEAQIRRGAQKLEYSLGAANPVAA